MDRRAVKRLLVRSMYGSQDRWAKAVEIAIANGWTREEVQRVACCYHPVTWLIVAAFLSPIAILLFSST